MPINNSMAPAQVYSFVSQAIYLATYLIRYSSFNCSLSVEEIGDIGVDGERNEIVELKNAQHVSHNPLSNSSIDLWKSLYNWTMFFYENKNFMINDFRLLLYVNSKNECKTDIARYINECNCKNDYDDIIKRIKTDILKNVKYKRRKLTCIKKKKLVVQVNFILNVCYRQNYMRFLKKYVSNLNMKKAI